MLKKLNIRIGDSYFAWTGLVKFSVPGNFFDIKTREIPLDKDFFLFLNRYLHP